MKTKLLLLSFGACSFFNTAYGTEADCGLISNATKSKTELNDLKLAMSEGLEEPSNYFTMACQIREPESENFEYNQRLRQGLRSKPSTQSLRTNLPSIDLEGRTTQDFFNKVLDKVNALREINSGIAIAIANCTSTQNPQQKNCEPEINDWLKKDLPKMVSLSRFNLAMAYSSSDNSMFQGANAKVNPNLQLDPIGSYKEIPWEPLSSDEKTLVKSYFKNLDQEAWKATLNSTGKVERHDQIYLDKLLKARHTHYMIYLSFIGINPIMQYLQSANPKPDEINHATKQVLAALDDESSHINSIKASLNHPISIGRDGRKTFDSKVMDLLKYRAEIEEVLQENPEYCGLGLAAKQIENNNGNVSLAMGVAGIVGSFFLGPISATAFAGASAGYYSYTAQKDYELNRLIQVSRVQKSGYSDFQKLLEENTNVDQLRQKLQQDVSQLYRGDLQELKVSEVNRKITFTTTPMLFLPGAFKFATAFKSRLPKISLPKMRNKK